MPCALAFSLVTNLFNWSNGAIQILRRRFPRIEDSQTANILVSPMQNGFIERINRGYREAILDMLVFQSLREVCE